MNTTEKLAHWGEQVKKFLTDSPREANTEGGVFPAIFGTVLMVILMSIVVMPFGVIAAVYLHEYAGNNLLTRVIRIAVVNWPACPRSSMASSASAFRLYDRRHARSAVLS